MEAFIIVCLLVAYYGACRFFYVYGRESVYRELREQRGQNISAPDYYASLERRPLCARCKSPDHHVSECEFGA